MVFTSDLHWFKIVCQNQCVFKSLAYERSSIQTMHGGKRQNEILKNFQLWKAVLVAVFNGSLFLEQKGILW